MDVTVLNALSLSLRDEITPVHKSVLSEKKAEILITWATTLWMTTYPQFGSRGTNINNFI